MLIYKIVHDILPSKIDPFYRGNEQSLATYGRGSYFSKDEDYVKKYIYPWKKFSLELVFEVSGSSAHIGEKEVIRDEDNNVQAVL